MSTTAIHTRYSARGITATADRGAEKPFRLRVPYPHELPHHAKHPFAARQLAERLNWRGLWIVGDNGNGSISCARVPGSYSRAWVDKYIPGIEGEDWFFIEEETRPCGI